MSLPQAEPDGPVAHPAITGPSDERILDLIAEGHQHAFDIIVGRYAARVRRFVGQVTGHGAPAEDLTQGIFMKIFSAAGRFDGSRSFAAWLFKVAHNTAIDWLRAEERRTRHHAAHESEVRHRPSPGAPTPLQELERKEFAQQLAAAIRDLPDVHRSAFLLREQEGLSYEEIGEALQISPKTVSTRIHRARTHLRERLTAFLGEPMARDPEALS